MRFGLETLIGLLSLSSVLWKVNVAPYVTNVMPLVDDFLLWRTQFTNSVIIHHLQGKYLWVHDSISYVTLQLIIIWILQ